jgi:enoyl-CoA hydratase/carnithine racemase
MGDAFATLTLEGKGKNCLSTELMRSVIEQVGRAGGRPLLVVGSGDTFSAGLNLKEVAAADHDAMARYLGLLDDMIDALFSYAAPVAACVNGHAIAGGCVIALCADFRVAKDDPLVRIGLNEVALGLEFPPKILRVAKHRLAPPLRDRVLLEAGLYDPRTAQGFGFVDEVARDPLASVRAWLESVARHPADIYAATKRTLRAGALDLDDAERRYVQSHVLPRWTAPAVKEAARAALERRAG